MELDDDEVLEFNLEEAGSAINQADQLRDTPLKQTPSDDITSDKTITQQALPGPKANGQGTKAAAAAAGEINEGTPSETPHSYFDFEALDGINEIGDKIEAFKITIDSGAADSVCPREWAEGFKTVPCEPGKAKSFVSAGGTAINHYGDKKVTLKASGSKKILNMPFRVCDVRKPLASVKNICAKGNIVQFGSEPGESFIKNKRSGEKVLLEQDRGQYLLSADLVKDSTF